MVPLHLIGPEVTGVVIRGWVGDVLGQRVGEGHLGQHALRPVYDARVTHLQDDT